MKQNLPALFLSFVLTCIAAVFSFSSCLASDVTGKAVRIVDGDTLWIELDGRERVKIQLQGIDAPEMNELLGEESSLLLDSLARDKDVRIEEDGVDRFGRVLGYLYVGSMSVNREMVRLGAARYVSRYAPERADLQEAQEEARAARRGIWGGKEAKLDILTEAAEEREWTGRAVKIFDGDSFIFSTDGKEEMEVRLYGVDAPEKDQDYADKSRSVLSSLLSGKKLRLVEKDRDQYGRLVCRVYVGKTDVNFEMVRRGTAWHYARYAPGEHEWEEAQRKARAARKGLWAARRPMAPWDFRKDGRKNE